MKKSAASRKKSRMAWKMRVSAGLIDGELLAREIVSANPHPMLAAFRASRSSSGDVR
jgi:hypothetical protein